MKKKTVRILLAAMLATSMIAGCIGCGKTEEPKEDAKKEITVNQEKTDETDDIKELLKYVPKADKVKIVENAKNLDMDKILMDAVDEKQKSQVKDIQCDMKDADLTKKGTYTVPVTLTLKEQADGKDAAKTVKKKETAETSKDKKETAKTESTKDEKAKKPVSEKNVIQTEIKMEVISKDKAKELADKGNLVIQADGTAVKAESKEKDAEKKESGKKDDSKKSKESADNNADNTSTANNTNTNSGNSTNNGGSSSGSTNTGTPDNNTGGGEYVPPAQEQPAPTPPPVNHTWAPEMAEQQVWVEDYITVLLCGCGMQFNDFGSWNQHSIDGCDFGYTVTEIPGGGHYETQWVETGRYYCTSCGAYK